LKFSIQVEDPAPSQHGPEPLEELRDGREAQLEVRERDRRWLGRERAQRRRQRLRLLRGQPPFDPRRKRCGAEPEVAVALLLEPLGEPRCRLLGAPVLGEAPRELLSGLLGLEIRQLRLLVGEEPARL